MWGVSTMLAGRSILAAIFATCAVGCAANHESTPAQSESASATALAPAASPAPQPTAHVAAEAIKAAVPEVVSLIAITEDNDANDMIGRVNGYVAATVLLDSRLTGDCDVDKPGIVCGAGIEQWPDEQAARGRAEYIKSMLS